MDWITIGKLLNQFNEISVVSRILLAMLLGGIIGIEREKSKRPAGFRTHILVCVGASMTALIGLFVWHQMGNVTDPMRISAQVISGIGFLGVGTILVKEHDHITGLTTAAGLWTTAAIGIACGYGFYIAAVAGTLVVTVTSAILFKLEKGTRKKNSVVSIYLEIAGTETVNEYTDWFMQELEAKNVLITAPRSAIKHHVGVEIILPFGDKEEVKMILEKIREKENVAFAIESIRNNSHRN
ncbi:MAG: MgtC/SapB family protein [Lachnospiraceae bacterium]|nr:MgtC/SapB family protein [Lachnospiraceae bacterium]